MKKITSDMKLLRFGVNISVLVTLKYHQQCLEIYFVCGILRTSLMVTWTVGEKLRLNPTKSSISDDILTSVEKVVQGRGQSGALNPKYKFSKVAGDIVLLQYYEV